MWTSATQGEVQGVWFWAALYVLAVCAYSISYQLRVLAWPRTKGLLQHAGVEKFGATSLNPQNQDYGAAVEYSYSVAGESFTGHRVSPWVVITNNNLRSILRKQLSAIRKDANDTVEVFYNPKNPAKSFLLRPGRLGLCITFLLGFAPILSYVYRYHV